MRRSGVAGALASGGILLTLAGCQYARQILAPATAPPPRGASATIPGPAYRPAAGIAVAATDWPAYNRTADGARFSPLSEIDPRTVARLRPLCAYTLPNAVDMQSGPIEIGGTIFVTTEGSTYAIDAATCRLRWRHVYRLARRVPLDTNQVNRGLAYANGLLFRGSNDGRLYALDAATGHAVWNVPIGDPAKGETFPAAPLAWRGMVFIGNAGGDNFGVKGRMMAFDAATGAELWTTPLIAENGPARATWPPATFRHPQNGGATWTSYTIDRRSGTLFLSTGNAAPAFLPALRRGADFYTYGVLGLDARTGAIRFWRQLLRGEDFHDWDMAAAPVLATTPDGRRLLAAAGKDGYLYVLDRDSGRLAFRTGTTTIANAEAPLTPGGTRFCPGIDGGTEWNGPAFSPRTDAFYVNAVDWCSTVRSEPPAALEPREGLPWTGSDSRLRPFGARAARRSGWISAIDARSGAVLWRRHDAAPMIAGITATGGGLIFTADLAGAFLALDARSGALLYRFDTGQPIGGGVISYAVAGRQLVAVASGLDAWFGWNVTSGPARIIVFGLRP